MHCRALEREVNLFDETIERRVEDEYDDFDDEDEGEDFDDEDDEEEDEEEEEGTWQVAPRSFA